jgi:hypothetical protein
MIEIQQALAGLKLGAPQALRNLAHAYGVIGQARL